MSGRDELLAVLARVKPVSIAMVGDDGSTEWLAVPRGRAKWERLIDRTIGSRPWAELRLCDGRKATLEVVTAARQDDAPAADEPDAATAAAAMAGDPSAGFAVLLTGAVRDVARTLTAALTETVRTMRTESRAEQAELLTAHQAMARDAFQLRADAQSELAVERDRRLALEAELAELRARVNNQSAPEPEQQREAQIFELLTGGKKDNALPAGDPSQGMPGSKG